MLANPHHAIDSLHGRLDFVYSSPHPVSLLNWPVTTYGAVPSTSVNSFSKGSTGCLRTITGNLSASC